jgi:ABC-type oligopeptide transport system substrate-binding subunit
MSETSVILGSYFQRGQEAFDDERVRKALTLAIDRYDMLKTLTEIEG